MKVRLIGNQSMCRWCHYPTAIRLCSQHLLYNDTLKQKTYLLPVKKGGSGGTHSPCCLSQHSRYPEPWQPHNAHAGCSFLTKETPRWDTAQGSWRETEREIKSESRIGTESWPLKRQLRTRGQECGPHLTHCDHSTQLEKERYSQHWHIGLWFKKKKKKQLVLF